MKTTGLAKQGNYEKTWLGFVLVSPAWFGSIDWAENKVNVDPTAG